MPLTSEEIFYADNESVMSVETLSAARATSAGDRISKLMLQAGNTVASDFERDEMFPDPKQGDVVWRSDLAIEQRYFELYSSVNLQGRTPAGWYAVKNNFVPIISNGTFSGDAINLTNIFTLTFNNYLILGNVNLNAAGNLFARFSVNGVPEVALQYQRTRVSGNNNTTTSAFAANNTQMFLAEHSLITSNRFCFQALISNPMQNLHSKMTTDFGSVTQTTNSSVGTASNILLNTKSYDGFYFFATLSRLMTGNVSVYGYN